MKRLVALFSIVLIFSMELLFFGCANKNETVQTEIQSDSGNIEESEQPIESEFNNEADFGSEYEFINMPLNIKEDKYRNFYEIFVYSFCDTNDDGIGDLNGVTQKLDYISDMGFNAIWLMPIMPSDTYHKYDVIDYMGIDNEYGTIEDMQNLIKEAHSKNIRVIIDFVMNHSSSKNEWFKEACDYLRTVGDGSDKSIQEMISDCKYVGYYHFEKEKISGTYYNVPGTDWYYEGSFWSEMPDLNYNSKDLRDEFEKIADFWVGKVGVDGFRMDATMHFEEGDTEFNNEVMNWIYNYCKNINPEFYMVSEVWSSESTIADYYKSETDSMFNFDAGNAEGKIIKAAKGSLKADKFVNSMLDYEKTFKEAYEDYIDAVFITNHDMGRVCNALMSEEDAIKYAGGLLMSMNGSTYVYYGEEIGMKSKGNKDENKRLPIDWGDEKENTKGPENADSNIEQSYENVKMQMINKNSILNYYKQALLIRNQNPEIARGTIKIVNEYTDGNLAMIIKSYEGNSIGIIYNNSKDENYEVDFSHSEYEKMEIVGYLTTDGQCIKKNEGIIDMPPRSIVYIK